MVDEKNAYFLSPENKLLKMYLEDKIENLKSNIE